MIKMSRPREMNASTQKTVSSTELDSLQDGLSSVMLSEGDKPDAKPSLEMGSPVSPLPARPGSAAITNTTSSSSSSSGSSAANAAARRSDVGLYGRRTSSGELLPPEPGPSGSNERNSRPGHRRSGSGPLIYSSGIGGVISGGGISANGFSVSSPATNVLPAGNICPSGKIATTGMAARAAARSDVLGSGTGNYGHGSVMRGMAKSGGEAGTANDLTRKAMGSMDAEEVKRGGNEFYKRGQFSEALRLYDRAIMLCPDNAAYRSNRAAALTGLGKFGEAVRACEEAILIDPAFGRAHRRLASLHIRLGQVENARRHLFLAGPQPDPVELQKIQAVERHLARCADARKIGDWKSALRESDAAISSGADSSSLLVASRAEALLRLHQLDDADLALSNACKLEASSPSCLETKFFEMLSSSYINMVQAQVEMALGRFENAAALAEKARQMDPGNIEVTRTLNNVRSVARARARGNELFKLGNFEDACLAYGEGLKHDPSNPVLLCNRAACRSKLGQWERSIEDCNEALRTKPNYTKALLRRATSNAKLERWAESVQDYETLRKELPCDTEVAEALFHAQVALKTSRGEEISNLKFGGEVEEITGLEHFQASISLPGVSVVQFTAPLNQHCIQMSPFMDGLCIRYPSVNFLKVDVDEIPAVAKAENVRTVPTFKIYKNGSRVKEMICPSQQLLENSVRHYGI